MLKRFAGLLFVSATLAGCATEYGDIGFTGGVDSQPLGGDAYRIVARGNAFTDPSRIEDFVLLRAAETALDNGAGYFAIMSRSDRTSTGQFTTPGQSTTTGSGTFSGSQFGNSVYGSMQGSSTTTYNPSQTFEFARPGEDAIILISEEPCSECLDALQVYNAISVRHGLSPRRQSAPATNRDIRSGYQQAPAEPAESPNANPTERPSSQIQVNTTRSRQGADENEDVNSPSSEDEDRNPFGPGR